MRSCFYCGCGLLLLFGGAREVAAQTAIVVEFPQPAQFYQNTSFAISGGAGFVTTFDADVLWSFDLDSGALLDADGLALPAPGTASDVFIFAGARAAIPGWFPSQAVFVADLSYPANLQQAGIIEIGAGTNIQGQNIAIDDNGHTGYVASYPNDTLYSFDVVSLKLENSLALPGNPDRIALAGDRLAIVDTSGGRLLVVDVSDPAHLAYVGAIEFPGANTFNSNDNIVFAADGRTGFVATNERVVFSFDIQTLTVLDPDGLAVGNQLYSENLALAGSTLACLWSRGVAFIDASDPYALRLISNGQFGGTVAPQGNATCAFTRDGRAAAVPMIYPGNYVYTLDVATGAQLQPRFPVGDQPNFLTIFGPDRVGVLCSAKDDEIWLIDGLFGLAGDLNCDGNVDFGDINPFVLALSDPAGYAQQFPDCSIENADINGDGAVNFGDVNPFIALLSGN